MATNPFISGRIPEELNKKVIEYCKRHKIGRTKLLALALSTYIEQDLYQPENVADPTVLACIAKLIDNQAFLAKTLQKNRANLAPTEVQKLRHIHETANTFKDE